MERESTSTNEWVSKIDDISPISFIQNVFMNYLLQIFAYTRYFSDYGPNLLVSNAHKKTIQFKSIVSN